MGVNIIIGFRLLNITRVNIQVIIMPVKFQYFESSDYSISDVALSDTEVPKSNRY